MALYKADSVAIDIEGLAAFIKARMYQDLFISSNCYIFKTPTILGRINEKAYVPEAFSIGPFHHGRPEKNECYAGPIGYSLDEFVRIIVIDGCFIIELFRKIAYKELREKNDLIFTESCMLSFLLHDLILLENQVPWMVMDCLFNMTMDPTHNEPLIEPVKTFLHPFFFTELLYGYPPITNGKHIVDVCRKLLVSSITGEKGQLDWTLPSAMILVEAGVKIKNGESKSFLDIKYENSVLEIPPLGIEETTETLFQNIISFEQCCPDCELRFTSYTILLDNLINTSKDMDILYKNKVIDSWLNPYDVVPFFNKLWPRWHAILVRNYFNTQWAILSTTAAAILLFLSFLQTWYTIY
ncbi:hypothetical protein ACB092_01G282000 [Castanea dentata]